MMSWKELIDKVALEFENPDVVSSNTPLYTLMTLLPVADVYFMKHTLADPHQAGLLYNTLKHSSHDLWGTYASRSLNIEYTDDESAYNYIQDFFQYNCDDEVFEEFKAKVDSIPQALLRQLTKLTPDYIRVHYSDDFHGVIDPTHKFGLNDLDRLVLYIFDYTCTMNANKASKWKEEKYNKFSEICIGDLGFQVMVIPYLRKENSCKIIPGDFFDDFEIRSPYSNLLERSTLYLEEFRNLFGHEQAFQDTIDKDLNDYDPWEKSLDSNIDEIQIFQ